MQIKRFHHRSGFTMIELLVVTTIMILLTTLGLVSYTTASRRARNSKRHVDMETMRSALVLFKSDAADGCYPTGTFTQARDNLASTGYLSENTMADPKNTGVYVYNYVRNSCKTFTLTGYDEPDPGTAFTLRNP